MAERLTPTLRRRVLDLPIADRLSLLVELRASIEALKMGGDTRMDYLADKMAAITGVDVRTQHDNKGRTVWARNIFVFVARREGFTQRYIGEVIGRNHTSVCFAERRVCEAFALPDQYPEELNLYNKFVESL